MKVFNLLLLTLFLITDINCSQLVEKFTWRELEYSWSTEDAKQEAIRNGNYIPSNNLPLAFDVWRDKIFLTVPRWKTGIASTLSYIENSNNEKSPILHPFPNFSMNQLPNEENEAQQNSIISAFGIRVDECDRLWIVDCGLTNLLGTPKKFRNPSLLVFDLNNDGTLIRRFEIPENQIKADSFFVNVFVDTQKDKCSETFAYIVDIYGFGTVVYDYKQDKSWRVNHNYFSFDPIHGDLNVAGINFQWHDGVFGMALGKLNNDYGDRTLYFHSLASTYEFSVENAVLKNETFSTSPSSALYHSFNFLGSRGLNSQSSSEVYDAITNVIFYTQINRNAIGCWNIKKPYISENQGIVANDDEVLIFPNDLRLDGDGNLYVLSNRMPIFMYSNLDSTSYNYRIMMGKTTEIIKGTPCE
ncbi:hypothetical protein PVAND_009541 [Polypedilum vanderplanki]|uniref:Uncharacterized protein n=1 Tax=Polypedilum vanderplanki TaxID=319348 RepID=A0A9J6CDW5_POLVA|nr:hypothetical protein PVAND_009541 [Polypedilum vanderplanki]